MRDEMDSRLWVDHGARFSNDLHAFLVGLGRAFARLHNIQWDAPWRRAAVRRNRVGHA